MCRRNGIDRISKMLFSHRTVFEQHGTIDIKGLGPFGRVMEVFAKHFLHNGVKRVSIFHVQ